MKGMKSIRAKHFWAAYAIIATLVFLVGYSRMPRTVAGGTGDVDEIVRKFVLEADARHVHFHFSLSNVTIVPDLDAMMGGDLRLAQPLAYCQPNTNEIVINDAQWDNFNDVAREMILFHELGHCMLQRDHLEDMKPDGTKVSLMSARKRWNKNANYLAHRKEYLDELFDPARYGDLNHANKQLYGLDAQTHQPRKPRLKQEARDFCTSRIRETLYEAGVTEDKILLITEGCIYGYMNGKLSRGNQ